MMVVKKSAKRKEASPPCFLKKSERHGGSKGMHKNVLFESCPKDFGIGQNIQPKRDLTRFVRWPKYIRAQRQKATLMKRLKIPPPLHQFSCTVDKQTQQQIVRLVRKYRPESRKMKKQRLFSLAAAQQQDVDLPVSKKCPINIKSGVNLVYKLVEQKKAKFVLIASDVEPIEIVLALPALCRKFMVPYCIVKSKALLGSFVRRKTASCLAITDVKPEDHSALNKLKELASSQYNECDEEIKKTWGGGIMSARSVSRKAIVERAQLKEVMQVV